VKRKRVGLLRSGSILSVCFECDALPFLLMSHKRVAELEYIMYMLGQRSWISSLQSGQLELGRGRGDSCWEAPFRQIPGVRQ
jgi:hypothetical protein